MPPISLLITDLDNTLYDWVSFFARAFNGMVDVATEILHVDRDQLLDDLKAVHVANRDSEQPFSLLETATVHRQLQALSRHERYLELQPAFRAFDELRARHLTLYPGVKETLARIAATGCSIVAHTEANIVNALVRLEKLDLLELIPVVYTVRVERNSHPDAGREPIVKRLGHRVRCRQTSARKPDVQVVEEICRDAQVSPTETLYVGDSIAADIGMAKAAGAWAAWARYGTEYDRQLWKDLVRVTHWTVDDVARAQQASELYGSVRPDVVLEGFSDLLAAFEFAAPPARSTANRPVAEKKPAVG
jgi:phosphoglycolate phosphatase-like HAD superfamily hydrolase